MLEPCPSLGVVWIHCPKPVAACIYHASWFPAQPPPVVDIIYILYLFNLHPTSSHIPKLSLAYPHYFNKAGHLFDPTDPHPTVPVPPAHLEQVSRTAMRPAWIVPGIRRRSDGRISGGFRVRSGNFQKSPSKRSTYRFFFDVFWRCRIWVKELGICL